MIIGIIIGTFIGAALGVELMCLLQIGRRKWVFC